MYNMAMKTRQTPESTRPLRAARAPGRPVPPRRRTNWLWPALAVVLLGLVVAGGLALSRRGQSGEIAGVTTFGNPSREHTDAPVTFPQTPPVGGQHHPQWQTCGIYEAPIGSNYAVHSLEHGAVWLTYRPDLPEADVEQLRTLVRGRSHALLSPYPDLPSPVAASAWGVNLQVESASDPRLRQFVDQYERGRQTPEPGATCRGGVSN